MYKTLREDVIFFVFFVVVHCFVSRTRFSAHETLSTALSPACAQRDGGLAQGGLPLNFLWAINVQFRTKFSAGLLPPLRQTACCAFGHLSRVLSVSLFCRAVLPFRIVVILFYKNRIGSRISFSICKVLRNTVFPEFGNPI